MRFNPPYSSGQDSANDNNANEKYPDLDEAIRDTYAAHSSATNKNSLYDSYIRAIKWASLRLKDRGVIAYVTNGGWLDSNTADGMRKTLADEFSDIYVYNLRGDTRTSGEQARKEGGQTFGPGSRATVAITVLVKDPAKTGPATIHYTDVGDYLTREQKLVAVEKAGCVKGLEPVTPIVPDEYGDWLNQRRDDFHTFMPLGSKADEPAIFGLFSGGLKTNRDAWCYNSSREALETNMRRLIDTYESDRTALGTGVETTFDPTLISWSRNLTTALRKKTELRFHAGSARRAMYRPFDAQNVYFASILNERRYRLPTLFPAPELNNVGVYQVGAGSAVPFSVGVLDSLPDLHVTGAGSGGQFFARYRYEKADEDMLDINTTTDDRVVLEGYRRIDNVTDEALARFQAAYDTSITKDDIFAYVYGLLHSPEYRETYAADLKKDAPAHPAR